MFFGGGTPTLLPAADLTRILRRIDERFGLEAGAEVTTEANPESVDPAKLEALREAGFTRISLGMQSAVPRVLATLDRVHSPGRPQQAVAEARAAGFDQVSLDLIYGTPGETADDWRRSLDAALSAEPDHLSTYSLIVEPGTRLAAQVRRGELEVPGEHVIVDRFETAERVLAEAGMAWYETCSWATGEAAWCRHNLGYWGGGDWWGAGPGAHSHVGGVRWWNVLHPRAWSERLANGTSPAAARETPGEDERSPRARDARAATAGRRRPRRPHPRRTGRRRPPRRRRAPGTGGPCGRPRRADPPRPPARRSGDDRSGRLNR